MNDHETQHRTEYHDVYAHLLQHPSRDPVGLAVYVELRYMTASLMLGEWFE